MRDYSAPTGEDQYDKSILPKVMQVRSLILPRGRVPGEGCSSRLPIANCPPTTVPV